MKKKILSIALAAVLSTGLFSAPVQEYISTSAVASAATTVAAPTASKKSGTYSASGAFSVKLTTSTSGATIYYSTGSSYKQYTKALKISKNTTELISRRNNFGVSVSFSGSAAGCGAAPPFCFKPAP